MEEQPGRAVMPHGDGASRAIAAEGLVLKVLVGSGVHGTAIEGTDDTDYMGICIEGPAAVIGVAPPWSRPFEQYQYRSAAERSGVLDAPSGPGDVDEVVYSLRKWLRLALAGNPTVLLPLFTPEPDIVVMTEWGREIRRAVPGFAPSRSAGERFLGYFRAQREKLLGLRSTRTHRPELLAAHGFDTKFAMHMIRLGIQGIEYLETGRITLPLPEPDRTWLVELRQGGHSQQEALQRADLLESRLEDLIVTSTLPHWPDYDRANRWVVQAYQDFWAGRPPALAGG
jgi:predicted nucleotidyltransferase